MADTDRPLVYVVTRVSGTATMGTATTTTGTAVMSGLAIPAAPDYLTVQQAAAMTGRAPGLIRRWIGSGKLPATRVVESPNMPWLIRPSDLAQVAGKTQRRRKRGQAS